VSGVPDTVTVLLDVLGVRMEMPSNQPLVMLKEAEGSRYLPIWIGANEAVAIAFAHQGVTFGRPLTHDLFRDALAALSVTVERVVITEMREGTFYATLVLQGAAGEVQLSARPSDAIALALRTSTPVYASVSLLEEVAFEVPAEVEAQESESEVARFRAFLDNISPEDFTG
jgi:bifunctional DNase/RNase